MKDMQEKIRFFGRIVSVQPRANVWRYRLDNRSHGMKGYNLFLKGVADSEDKDFSIAISEKQQEKLRFHFGDEISGTAWTKLYPKLDYADYYRAGALKKIKPADFVDEEKTSPWEGEVPSLDVYNWRGCRMLDGRRWRGKCFTCKWACMANVIIEYDWGVSQRLSFESYCYGPKSASGMPWGAPDLSPIKMREFIMMTVNWTSSVQKIVVMMIKREGYICCLEVTI